MIVTVTMKRKINSFSNFKYKRRCPVVKEDIDLSGSESSDEELLKNPFKKLCKDEKNETKSSEKNSAKLVPNSSSDDEDNVCFKKGDSKSTLNDNTSNGLTTNARISFEKDDTKYRLGVLKGIFKDEYSDKELLDAINDSNGLDHAISVLVDSPVKNKGNTFIYTKMTLSSNHTIIMYHNHTSTMHHYITIP